MNYFNKKGSTLAFVMIVIAILSLLGVTLLTVTLAGFTMKVNEGYNKKAFYIAEGGLEQANAIIEKAMQDASEYARSDAQAGFDAFILLENKKQADARENAAIIYNNKYVSPYLYQRNFEISGTPTYENGNVIETRDVTGKLIKKYTYDYNNNLVSEFDSYGKEIPPSIYRVDAARHFIPLDSTDLNAKQDGLVESMVNKKLNEYYASAYVNYLKIGIPAISPDNLKQKLEMLITYNAVSYENPIKDLVKDVEVKAIKDFGVIIQDPNGLYQQSNTANEMEITFRSSAAVGQVTGASTNDKTLESTFKIGIPPYDAPVLKGNEIVKLKKNALFDKTLVSYKNIIVTGKNVTVNGNIFAKGDDSMATDNMDYLHMGGIIVGDVYNHAAINNSGEKEGKLTVNGTIATSGYLQTRNSYSEIIANGNVYCNSLVAQQDWESDPDGVFHDNKITLNKDLNLLDNLNLNSRNTQVKIMGSFFGFSSGSGSSSLHNQSSSIAINDVDIGKIGNTTSLDIEGGGDGTKYNIAGVENKLDPGTYIAGTVYVNYGLVIKVKTAPIYGSVTVDSDGGWTYKRNSGAVSDEDNFVLNVMNNTFGGDEDHAIVINAGDIDENGRIASNYQTGDSISISGNYLSYSLKLSDATVRSYVGDANYSVYFNFIDIPDEYFEDVPPLSLISSIPGKMLTTVDDKSLYARMQRLQDKDNLPEDQFYNFGDKMIQVKNMRFSLGNFIENKGSVNDFQAMMAGSLKSGSIEESVNGKMGLGKLNDENEFEKKFKYKEKEYKYYVNKLSDPQIDNYVENIVTDLNINNSISDFFKFPALGSYENNSNIVNYVSGTGVNPEAISLQGPGSNLIEGVLPTGCRKVIVNESLKGIIFSRGDVYISGKINFTGTIVTEGNIYILDNNDKRFTNDYNPNLLSNTNNLIIKKIMESNLQTGTQIGDMFVQDNPSWTNEIVFTKDSNTEILNSGNVKTYTNRLSSFLKISQWKRIN